MAHSCALMRAANLRILDYPFEAALASALSICDEAVVIVSESQDDTDARVHGLARQYLGRVLVAHQTFLYDRGWQERWWGFASRLCEPAEWLLWLDADEVIAPEHAPALRKQMADENVPLIRFPFVHFYATPRYEIEFALTHNTRLGRRSAGFRMVNAPGGAACHVITDDCPNAHGAPDAVTVELPILHYGWCRDAQALAISQAKQAAWYGNGNKNGQVSQAVPYNFELAAHLRSGRARLYTSQHPEYLNEWFAEHETAWQAIESEVEAQPA